MAKQRRDNARTPGTRPLHRAEMSLDEFIGENQKALKFALDSVAPEVYTQIAKRCPVKTGDLKDSIKVKTTAGRKPRLDVSTLFYGEYQDVDPGYRPFITPVIDDQRDKWTNKIAKYIRDYKRKHKTLKLVKEFKKGK